MKTLLTLSLVMVISLTTMQASGQLTEQSSSGWALRWNMTDDPTTEDLNTNGTNDWQWASGAGWGNGGGTFADGIMTLDGSVLYHEFYGDDAFLGQTAALGHTVEFRVKVNVASFDVRANIDGQRHAVKIHPDAIYTGPTTAIAYTGTPLLTVDASDAFHTYRLAKHPDVNEWSFWRDGVLLEDAVAGDSDSGTSFVMGSFNASYPDFQADYYALTAGAWAPVVVPEPSSLLLLLTGLIGLASFRRRR